MEDRFDTLAKSLAEGISRRAALRWIGAGLAGVVLAPLGLGTKAWSAPAPSSGCQKFCRDCGISPANGNAFGQCVSSCERCLHTGGKVCVCPTAASPRVGCCDEDAVCCPVRGSSHGVCCGPGLVCDPGDRGCVPP
jgi:hypothetical protein